MKYNLSANQKAVFDLKLEEQIDIIDTIIFDFILSFSSSPSCKKFIENDKLYFWVKWDLITKNIPLLPVKTRGSVYKRIKKLIDCGLLESHSDNQTKSMSFYTLTKKADRFLIGNLSNSQEDTPYSSKDTGSEDSVSQNVQGCIAKDTPPVSNSVHNNSIIDNSINNNNISKEHSEKESTKIKEVVSINPPQTEEEDTKFSWQQIGEERSVLIQKHFEVFKLRGTPLTNYSDARQISYMLMSKEIEADYPVMLEYYSKLRTENLQDWTYSLFKWLSEGWKSCDWKKVYLDLSSKKAVKAKELEEKSKKFGFKDTSTPTSISLPKKPVNGFSIPK